MKYSLSWHVFIVVLILKHVSRGKLNKPFESETFFSTNERIHYILFYRFYELCLKTYTTETMCISDRYLQCDAIRWEQFENWHFSKGMEWGQTQYFFFENSQLLLLKGLSEIVYTIAIICPRTIKFFFCLRNGFISSI